MAGARKQVDIHTDGACLGNPGPGGWAALLRWRGYERELAGGAAETTNNRMELMATIAALEGLREPCNVVLTTDSQYVRQGITQWLDQWLRRGWKTAAGGAVKNRDLWERLPLRPRSRTGSRRADRIAVGARAPWPRRLSDSG